MGLMYRVDGVLICQLIPQYSNPVWEEASLQLETGLKVLVFAVFSTMESILFHTVSLSISSHGSHWQ